MSSIYAQYGCGWSAPDEWRNFDASPTLRFERVPIVGKLYSRNGKRFPANVEYGDIVKGLPLPDNYCQALYCSHVLEHLSLDELRVALKNSLKILKSGGVFRLVMPDLRQLAENYINDDSVTASIKFIKDSGLGRESRAKDLKSFIIQWLGNSQHLWLWDYNSIEKELKDIGFINIRRAKYGDSIDKNFLKVEDIDRWRGCLGVECQKM